MKLNDYFLIFILQLIVSVNAFTSKPPIVKLKIDEESPLHTTLGNISSYLFSQSKITSDSIFFTVTQNGLIQLIRRLDLETLCLEQALCCEHNKLCELTSNVVIEGVNSEELELVELNILIQDINDHVPQFISGNNQIVKISELAEIGSTLNLMPASDADLAPDNQIQRYAIHGVELQQTFELDTSDLPNVRLRLTQPLDYELTTNYSGIIEACDRRQCAQQNLTILVIDANDNKPMFVQHSYELTIPENFSVGQTVLVLNAIDKDSELNARMDFRLQGDVDMNLKKTFRLDSHSGHLILQSRLAAHQRSEYRFSVTVSEVLSSQVQSIDALSSRIPVTSTDTANVIITVQDLNDFSPSIRMISPMEGKHLSIQENSAHVRVCVLQVTDNDLHDNGRVQCRLVANSFEPSSSTSDSHNSTSTDSFELTQTGNHYTLLTTRSFDAELEPQLTVTIACTDYGVPPRSSSRELMIQVEDVNEYPPELERINYHASIMENVKSGIEVMQVVAHDRDQAAKLTYELSNEGKQYFTIDPITGVITTLGGDEKDENGNLLSFSLLDREKTEKITFSVCVTDGTPTNGCGLIALDHHSTMNNKEREKHSQQPANPLGDISRPVFTASATIFVTVLDVNDNQPQFITKGPFSILENQPRFTQINGRLTALDADAGENGHVRYSIRHIWISATGIPSPDVFEVDSEGQIRTMEVMDREQINAYTLEIVACDSAPLNPLCTELNITITVLDENDNKPEWHYPHARDKEVNITSDLPPGRVVARILAMDLDTGENGRVIYSLIDPHKRTVFQIDNITGEISVVKNNLNELGQNGDGTYILDDSIHSTPLLPGVYRLRLRASDMGHPEQATETWLQVNVFGSDSITNVGLNFMIIIVMIAITGLISVCLVVAIICVRRRSSLQWNRPQGHAQTNGFRRGRSAGDGAEGSMFPLKHEYNYPLDGNGYMMSISPTPSDLDALKLGYQPNGGTYLDNLHSAPDMHPYDWNNPNSPPGVYYSSQSGPGGINTTKNYPFCSLAMDQNISNQINTLHLPMYTQVNRMTPTFQSDSGTFFRYPTYGIQPHLVGTSSCLNFSACSPNGTDQISAQTNALSSFTEVLADSTVTTTSTIGPTLSELRETEICNLGSHNSRNNCECEHNPLSLPRQSYAPLIIGTNNGIGCCYSTSNRRIPNGNIHCELDVESADSGRGASEDDPSQLTGQFMHFYPTCHLANIPHASLIHRNNSPSINNVNGITTSTCVQNIKLQSNSTNNPSGIVVLTGEVTESEGCTGGEQTESNWNDTSAVRRLKL
ncbi:Protocadherin-23 [Schistosoma japonicum]|nr:Protocadherin-23 [Schistosoma japonicum]